MEPPALTLHRCFHRAWQKQRIREFEYMALMAVITEHPDRTRAFEASVASARQKNDLSGNLWPIVRVHGVAAWGVPINLDECRRLARQAFRFVPEKSE